MLGLGIEVVLKCEKKSFGINEKRNMARRAVKFSMLFFSLFLHSDYSLLVSWFLKKVVKMQLGNK